MRKPSVEVKVTRRQVWDGCRWTWAEVHSFVVRLTVRNTLAREPPPRVLPPRGRKATIPTNNRLLRPK